MDLIQDQEFQRAHARLVRAVNEKAWQYRSDPVEDPDDPATVQAMQIALNLPKSNPPSRNACLVAAAQAVVSVCLDPRAGAADPHDPFVAGLDEWYGRRIRKVARRSRNKAWDTVQTLPGVTVDNMARAFVPSSIAHIPPEIAKLQIGGTELPYDEQEPEANVDFPTIVVDRGLGMSLGKAAAQVGHGSMLLAAAMTTGEAAAWAESGYCLSVQEAPSAVFEAALEQVAAFPESGIIVRDAGFTEVAPDSATVVALRGTSNNMAIAMTRSTEPS